MHSGLTLSFNKLKLSNEGPLEKVNAESGIVIWVSLNFDLNIINVNRENIVSLILNYSSFFSCTGGSKKNSTHRNCLSLEVSAYSKTLSITVH